jgi:hypothetical protein
MSKTFTRTAAVLAGSLLGLTATGTASADTEAGRTIHGTFQDVNDFIDEEVCAPEGFSPVVHEVEEGHYSVLLDAQGNFVHGLLHITYTSDMSANGKSLHEVDHWTDMFHADGSMQRVGLTVHVMGPGGPVQLDAGRILFNPDGTVASISGPHPQFEGQTWCFALQ